MIGFPNHKYLNRMAEPQKMVVYRRFERKNRKYEGGWVKTKETLILSGKLAIIKNRNGLKTRDKHQQALY